ncbi:alanine racemase [Reinekea marina]|uniref:Alanine racemase n=1 Tax=Reinekea marina TaxID=1310421 RepID=A0ABV7WT67_9GAMM|nr:alanine racemase [Reinekea marina]MDN3648984.1 alanine racemase [Reinekea marina]
MARAATATINIEAFRHNYRLAKSLARSAKAVAIIKADAYGHGAIKMAYALENEADAFGVACIEEAVELREAGIQKPILLLEGFFSADELQTISELNLWCAVHSLEQIDALANTKLINPIHVWLKMDSGMHRLGVMPKEYRSAFARLNQLEQVAEVVLMTHFANADNIGCPITAQQMQCFDEVTHDLNAPISIANSAATLGYENARRQFQRPGIMLYGATPFSNPHPIADQLQPVMSLTSEIIAIREVPAGEGVGYSHRYVCNQPTLVGTVAMGYADGYPRHAKDGTPVMVNGQRTALIGRVSMDMLTVDLTQVTGAQVGSKVELWGDSLAAAEVATYCDTIPYTLFTGVTRRVHKRYINE